MKIKIKHILVLCAALLAFAIFEEFFLEFIVKYNAHQIALKEEIASKYIQNINYNTSLLRFAIYSDIFDPECGEKSSDRCFDWRTFQHVENVVTNKDRSARLNLVVARSCPENVACLSSKSGVIYYPIDAQQFSEIFSHFSGNRYCSDENFSSFSYRVQICFREMLVDGRLWQVVIEPRYEQPYLLRVFASVWFRSSSVITVDYARSVIF